MPLVCHLADALAPRVLVQLEWMGELIPGPGGNQTPHTHTDTPDKRGSTEYLARRNKNYFGSVLQWSGCGIDMRHAMHIAPPHD